MKRKTAIVIFFFSLCFLTPGLIADEPQKKVMNYLAVMDLKCGEGIKKEQCAALTEIVINELVKIGKYKVVDRANRDKILSEAGFQQSGCVDESCTIDMGREMGVGKMVVGSITQIGTTYLLNLQLLNVETATVEATSDEECECELNGLIKAIRNAARKLMGEEPVSPQSTPQPQPTPSPSSSSPSADQIKFIAATPEQQKLCPADMVYVPAGWFMMGCNAAKDQQCQLNENPYHPVYLEAFCIDAYEYPNQQSAMPLGNTKWDQAQSICTSIGKRLPTEAEWEKAARGTDGRVYPWEGLLDSNKATFNVASGPEFSGSRPTNKSPYGTFDMAGNLWEWVADVYGENYYNISPTHNPIGPISGSTHILRGGAYLYAASYLRTSARIGEVTGPFKWKTVGFRCAKTP